MLLNQKSLSKKNISNQLTINAYELDVDQINSPTITTIQNDVATNTSNINTNTANINTNTANIATNTANISTNTTNIATNTADIAQAELDIVTLQVDIDNAETDIIALETKTQYLSVAGSETSLSTNLNLTAEKSIKSTGNFYLDSNNAGKLEVRSGGRVSTTQLTPITNNTYSLGNSTLRWTTVFATNGTINTSDRKQKKEIEELEDEWLDAIENIQPVKFKFIDDDERYHTGFIAQDVKEKMPYDTELYVEEDDFIGLRYMELVAPTIKYCQHLNDRVKILEEKLKDV